MLMMYAYSGACGNRYINGSLRLFLLLSFLLCEAPEACTTFHNGCRHNSCPPSDGANQSCKLIG